mmetsp:Transcript_21499/g.25406  ORF Transcript_21499/g.25406 Transcript_21499/m.25406 type:complete len:117 (+) Transcript_21499:311-661(+)
MNALHKKYAKDGLVVIGFPCNQFGAQEPGTNTEIKEFTKSRGVQFKIMNKIDVNGPNACDTYRFLKHAANEGDIQWNFHTYFVVSPSGEVKSFGDLFYKVETHIKELLSSLDVPDL